MVSEDHRAIQSIIARQFNSLDWAPGGSGDWDTFASDFFPGASLYPAARPAKRQTVDEFLERIKALAKTKLLTFKEALLGHQIIVFGNVAVAVAGCELTENNTEVNRQVEMMLLVKDGNAWQIVAQAWDTESPSKPLPPSFGDRR